VLPPRGFWVIEATLYPKSKNSGLGQVTSTVSCDLGRNATL